MNTQAKHTPGPWIVREYADGHLEVYGNAIESPNGVTQSDCIADKIYGEEHANARLIAAAPAMYEALTRLHDAVSEMVEEGQLVVGDTEDCVSEKNYSEVVEALLTSLAALAQAEVNSK